MDFYQNILFKQVRSISIIIQLCRLLSILHFANHDEFPLTTRLSPRFCTPRQGLLVPKRNNVIILDEMSVAMQNEGLRIGGKEYLYESETFCISECSLQP